MSHTDLYAPPASSVAGMTPAERTARANGDVVIAGIGQRIGATLIDWLSLLPLIALDAYLGGLSRGAAIGMNVAYVFIALILQVGLVRKYGGSPGKLMMGLRVQMMDGRAVTWKAAIVRYAVFWLVNLGLTVGQCLTILAMKDDIFLGMGIVARTLALSAQAPAWSEFLNYGIYIWGFACFVSVVCTKKRRALHDFLAGTVVVRPI